MRDFGTALIGDFELRRHQFFAAALLMTLPVQAQDQASDPALVGELMAFHGSKAIVEVMTTHCYETTGLDTVYKDAAANWYLRNISYLDLADRVIARLGGGTEGQLQAAETYGGSQIMTAYNQAPDKNVFCRTFLEQVVGGSLDIDKQLPDILKRAQDISAS
ncbi:hypothetical protein SAMN06295905_2115 [Devosia lucknowensis]|uniref:Uncharacterized protein n=1 Tax=Devosia lucknowensis TaxID=1096929 RepID=A0A1Y6FI78_9HYPH|nr:hypothetical protein [Devosia lucknowensis]SMQ72552.1 hypothetical protein SAMN06295905_2115 [Devosia lucknowensis]